MIANDLKIRMGTCSGIREAKMVKTSALWGAMCPGNHDVQRHMRMSQQS